MTTAERNIIQAFAEEILQNITRRSISGLQKMTATLSADDSGLINTWDEICVQLQHQESYYWDTYDQTARAWISGHIEELKEHEKLAVWLQTEEGLDWQYEDEQEREEPPPALDSDIEEYILHQYLYEAAANWSNKRIRKYLNRFYS